MAKDLSDSDLVRRSFKEPEIFEIIFDRYFCSIHSYFARRVGEIAADDLASDSFCIAFERRRNFNLQSVSIGPWLFGIANNLLKSRLLRDAVVSESIQRFVTPVGQFELVGELGRVGAAVAALDETDRESLLLFAWDGLSYEEISIALQIPPGTIRSKIHRARRQLRDRLRVSSTVEVKEAEGA